MLSIALVAIVVAAIVAVAEAESHTIHFINKCGFGTPTLVQNGNVLSTGANFTSNGPLIAATAFLQPGACGPDGENCTLVGTTLANPTVPGAGSSSFISLIPPQAFSVSSGFDYFNGCEGEGADCTNPDCPQAFHHPNDTVAQVECQVDNVGLDITFCD